MIIILFFADEKSQSCSSVFYHKRATTAHPVAASKRQTHTVAQSTKGNGPCGTKTHMVATGISIWVFLAALSQ